MINLAEVGNLALLSDAERNDIERNKRVFYRAKVMLSTMSRQAIKAELVKMPEDERESVRYALNKISKLA